MTSRERIRTVLKHEIPDRVPLLDGWYWPQTIERWRKEGLPENASPTEHFGMDEIGIVAFQTSLQLPTETIDETEDSIVYRDGDGAVVKAWKHRYATPSRLDASIRTWDAWREHKDRLAMNESMDQVRQAYDDLRKRECFVVIRPCEPMWYYLEHLMGFEIALEVLAEHPDLVADVVNTYTDLNHRIMQQMIDEGMQFDGLWFFSDLCYKNGLLYSPKAHREIVLPCHQRTWEYCRRYDMPMIFHCDGYMRELTPLLIEGGFDAVQPLEARCGNDVRELKRQYGTEVVFFGNISTDVMTRTKEDIFEEVSTKISIAKEGGGYMYHCDHSIPPTVSFENYSYVLELVREGGGY